MKGPVQYCTGLYSTVQYFLYITVQYCTVPYSTVQYCTVLYSAVQYCTVQEPYRTQDLFKKSICLGLTLWIYRDECGEFHCGNGVITETL